MTASVLEECSQFLARHGPLRVACLVAMLPAFLTYRFVHYVQTITGTVIHYLAFCAVLAIVFWAVDRTT